MRGRGVTVGGRSKYKKLQAPSITEEWRVAGAVKVKWKLIGGNVREVMEGQALSPSGALLANMKILPFSLSEMEATGRA